MSETTPEIVNVVLTFREPDGRQWIAGALLGPLQALGGAETLPVGEMPDRALMLVDFKIVHPTEVDHA
jgi:hypothetical protein